MRQVLRLSMDGILLKENCVKDECKNKMENKIAIKYALITSCKAF